MSFMADTRNYFISVLWILMLAQLGTSQKCYPRSVGNRDKAASGGDQFNRIGQTDSTYIVLDDGSGWSTGDPAPVNGEVSYTFPCCGTIDYWKIDAQNYPAGFCWLQVWRPNGANRYTLISQDRVDFTMAINNPTNWPVTTGSTINVITGDKLGFTGNLLEYKKSTNYNKNYAGTVLRQDTLNPLVGGTYTLSTESPDTDDNTAPEMIAYAIEARVVARSTSPTCRLDLAAASFGEDDPVGTPVGTVSIVTYGDPDVTVFTYTITSSNGMPLAIDNAGLLTVNGALSASPDFTDYKITVKAAETVCAYSGTCSATARVNWINKPITITNLPDAGNLIESTITTSTLIIIDTADDNRVTYVDTRPTCSIASTLPASGPFTVSQYAIFPTRFELKYDASSASKLNALLTPTYRITVQCEDQHASTTTGIYTLTVDKNQLPTVTNTPDVNGKICMDVDAMATSKFGIVLPLAVVDPEGDSVISTFTLTNSSSPFSYNEGMTYIYATADLKNERTSLHEFTLKITDKWNPTSSNTYDLCVRLNGLNKQPTFDNCPNAINDVTVYEDADPGFAVFTPVVTDANKIVDSQTFTFMWTMIPIPFQSLFTFETSDGSIKVGSGGLDYEGTLIYLVGIVPPCISVQLKVSDGVHFADNDCKLCFYIVNINEPPQFAVATQTIVFDEQTAPATLPTLDLRFVDEDKNDTHTYKIKSGDDDGYFSMDSNTGQLTLAKDCDYDDPSGCPHSFSLICEIKDAGGLTAETTIVVTDNDVNDNSPVFPQDPYHVTIINATGSGEPLVVFSATDADSGLNGEFTYSILGLGFGVEHFSVDNPGGNLRIKKLLALTQSTEFTITVCATDKGIPPLRNCTSVVISYTIVTTIKPPTTTREQPCFFCTEGGIAIFTLLMAVAGFAAFMATYCLWMKCCSNPFNEMIARLKLPRKPQVVRHKRRRMSDTSNDSDIPSTPRNARRHHSPPPPQQTTRFGFWNEGDAELDGTNPSPSKTVHAVV